MRSSDQERIMVIAFDKGSNRPAAMVLLKKRGYPPLLVNVSAQLLIFLISGTQEQLRHAPTFRRMQRDTLNQGEVHPYLPF